MDRKGLKEWNDKERGFSVIYRGCPDTAGYYVAYPRHHNGSTIVYNLHERLMPILDIDLMYWTGSEWKHTKETGQMAATQDMLWFDLEKISA